MQRGNIATLFAYGRVEFYFIDTLDRTSFSEAEACDERTVRVD